MIITVAPKRNVSTQSPGCLRWGGPSPNSGTHTITKTIANTGMTSSKMIEGAVIGRCPQCCRLAYGEFDRPRIPHKLVVIPRLSCRCRRATPPCAGCPRGRATWTRTNVGSAAGALSRTGWLNFPVRTKNARFRPCNDRAYRSAPGGRCVRPVERRGKPEVSAPAPCAITAETCSAPSPAFSATTVRPPRWGKTVPGPIVWVSCGEKN
jgi:hypothetical protein